MCGQHDIYGNVIGGDAKPVAAGKAAAAAARGYDPEYVAWLEKQTSGPVSP